MAVVITSYRQVVRAYPTSAGSYVVSKENLATIFGLIAGAALLADYVLTVAVSVSAGMLAIVSAMAARACTRTWSRCRSAASCLLTLVNLRGVRESGTRSSPSPTYRLHPVDVRADRRGVRRGAWATARRSGRRRPRSRPGAPPPTAGLFVILHSFASGSSALTGTEAISNGVSAFRRPQGRNASQTLAMLGVVAVTMIMGTAYPGAADATPTPSDASVGRLGDREGRSSRLEAGCGRCSG